MPYARSALVGVGGWLAFFIVTLGLNSLAVLVVTATTITRLSDRLPSNPGAGWSIYLGLTALIGLAKAVAYGLMAWRLNARHDASTTRLVVRLLWGVVLVPPVVDGLAGALLLGVDAGQVAGAIGIGIAKPFIYAAVWTAYLLRSERVANTYRGVGEAEESATIVT